MSLSSTLLTPKLVQQVREHFGFGPLCEYLSINYLDRFLSSYELPVSVQGSKDESFVLLMVSFSSHFDFNYWIHMQKGKAWTMQLLAVACLSLAAKIEETEVPLSLDLQVKIIGGVFLLKKIMLATLHTLLTLGLVQVGGSKYIFEARTIQRMEVLVLSTLRWRMQAITPFSFLDYFLYKVNDDERPEISSIMRSIQIISSKARGTYGIGLVWFGSRLLASSTKQKRQL